MTGQLPEWRAAIAPGGADLARPGQTRAVAQRLMAAACLALALFIAPVAGPGPFPASRASAQTLAQADTPARTAPDATAPASAPQASGAGGVANQADAPSAAGEAGRLAAEARAQALDRARQTFERARVQLAEIETILVRRNHSSAQLAELRAQLDAVSAELQEALSPLTRKASAARALLDQLGPQPDEKKDGPETPEAAAERENRQRAHAEFADTVRIGNALLLQASQLSETVASERRSTFTHALLDRSWSIFSPELWSFVASALPSNLHALATISSDWLATVRTRMADGRMLPFGLSLVALGLVWLARRLVVVRVRRQSRSHERPGPQRRVAVGLLVMASDVTAAILGCWLVYLGVQGSALAPPAVDTVLRVGLLASIAMTAARGLINVLLAPSAGQWRVLEAADQIAVPAAGFLTAAAAILLAGKLLDEILGAIGADHATSVAFQGLACAAIALTLAAMLRRMRGAAEGNEEGLGPYVPAEGAFSGMWRLAGWAIVTLTLLAVSAGFMPLATFITDQTMWALMLLGMVKLLLPVIDHGVGGLFAENSRLSLAMQTSVGVRKRSLKQIAVILAGALRIAVMAIAALLAVAPLGIDSTDFAGSIRNVFFGLSVAGLNISPVSILTGAGLLIAGVILTRTFQGWLRQKYLPATSLDSGLRNSITTAAGYLGVFIAAAATLAHFGLSLDRIAIVAGALSVGIGFGLQSIVNNFVSGLILLWDRSISVGDWIVVGAEQGHVKRISVRATEIQTFERASIIVPNSTLVSGTVKNWLRHNRTGRVSIVTPVGFQQDPETVSQLLLACAKAHPDVLREPPPSVLFNSFTASSQEFELRCFCDVEAMSRIRSELNYRIFRALTEAGIYAAPKPAVSEVRVLAPDDIQQLIRERLAAGPEKPDDAPVAP